MSQPTQRDVHVDRALTDLSVAYFQEAPPVSDRVFLRVPVPNKTDKYFVWDKADFWRDDARKRAPGSDFARIGIRVSTDNFSADQYALEHKIPDEDVANADAAIALKETATRNLTSRLNMRKDRAFATDFMTTSVWSTDKTGTTDFVKWNDATSDPAQRIALLQGLANLGIRHVWDLSERADASLQVITADGTLRPLTSGETLPFDPQLSAPRTMGRRNLGIAKNRSLATPVPRFAIATSTFPHGFELKRDGDGSGDLLLIRLVIASTDQSRRAVFAEATRQVSFRSE